MTQLTPEAYLDHIRSESARFGAVMAGCDPSARVPSCPDWDAADLLWHMTHVQQFWAQMVLDRPASGGDHETGPRPEGYPALLEAYAQASAALSEALEGVDPSEEAWTWSAANHTIGFILRRQAHEALIHRLDAELTADSVTELDPELAADGVQECLDVMYGGCPDWGSWEPLDTRVRIDCTDTDDQTWVQFGRFTGTHPGNGEVIDEEDFHVVEDPGTEPDAVIEGFAGDLDAWLWHRRDASGVHTAGDAAALERFRAVVAHPIN